MYGSQQDSGTAGVMSRTDHGEIDARDWFTVGGAESGYIAIDTKDDNILYVGDTTERWALRPPHRTIARPSPLAVANGGSPVASRSAIPLPVDGADRILSPSSRTRVLWVAIRVGVAGWRPELEEMSPDLTGDTRQDRAATAGP